MTCRERLIELSQRAEHRLTVFLSQLSQPFLLPAAANAHQQWIAAEEELRRFRNWFGDSQKALNDPCPEDAW
jgi:hypothetical protein